MRAFAKRHEHCCPDLLPPVKTLHVCSTHEVLCNLLPVLALIVANQLHQHQISIFRPLTFAGIATVRAKLQRSLGIQWVIHLSSFVLEQWGLRCLFSGLRTVHRRPVDRAHSGDRIQPTLSVAGYSHTHQPLCNRRCQRTGSSAELGQAAHAYAHRAATPSVFSPCLSF